MRKVETPRRKVGISPLKSRRMSRGQTIREVSEATGLSKQWIVVWELGEKEIPPSAERTLAKHFGITVKELRCFPDVMVVDRLGMILKKLERIEQHLGTQ